MSLTKYHNRHQWIAEAAYFQAEARNFAPGKELDDWLVAELAFWEMLIATYVAILAEDGPITVVGLRQLITVMGIKHLDYVTSAVELVWAIQEITQHHPCFRSENRWSCEEMDCKWRKECRQLVCVWHC